MIKFKTQLNFKYCFLNNFFKWSGGIVNKLFITFLILLFIVKIWTANYLGVIFIALVFFCIFFVLPVVKFLFTKFYHKMDYIEYFFGDDVFGYNIGEFDTKIEKKKIDHIIVRPYYVFIKVSKTRLHFVAMKEDVEKMKQWLLNSEYKTLFKDRE